MPLFMMISGYLFYSSNKKDFKPLMISKLRGYRNSLARVYTTHECRVVYTPVNQWEGARDFQSIPRHSGLQNEYVVLALVASQYGGSRSDYQSIQTDTGTIHRNVHPVYDQFLYT